MTPAEFRALIPATREGTYLDTATYGPASEQVVAALNEFTRSWSLGSVRFETWEAAAEDCRRGFARLLSTGPEDIAIQPYVSTAAGVIASQLRPGDRVVVNDLEFTSNLWPWLFQRDRGVEVAVVPARDGRCDLAGYEAAIGDRASIVAVSAVQSANGWRASLRPLADLAHRAGGLLFVDACQGAGGISLSPGRDGFDILATDSYKWLMGPRGAGYMYISPEARTRTRPVSVGPHSARDRHASYYGVEMDLSPAASRFDSSLSWMATMGDRESLRLLQEIGIDKIEEHNLRLASRFRTGVADIGLGTVDFPAEERSPIVSVLLDDPDLALARLLDGGVTAARRARGVRFSFHVFNNEADVDQALNGLEAARRAGAG